MTSAVVEERWKKLFPKGSQFFLFLNLCNGFHCPHNCRGRFSSLWPIIKSVGSLNWRCSDISLLSLVEGEGGNETKWCRKCEQNQRNGEKKKEKNKNKQHFWLFVRASWEYKVQACNNVSSVLVQFG